VSANLRIPLAAVVLSCAGLAGAARLAVAREPVETESAEDRQILQSFLAHVPGAARRLTPEAVAKIQEPEDICWTWSKYAHMPLAAYQLTGDRKYLDAFVTAMDGLLSGLRKAPDGYLGFRGLPLALFRDRNNPDALVEVDIAEFEVARLIAEFVEAVRADQAAMARHSAKAAAWIDLAEKHLAGPKWEARKWYVDLGPQGAVFRMPAECGNNRDSLTNPHNKQSKMCRAYLALYRVTGNDEYFKKAIKLGVRFKRTLRLDGDRYLWNYWEPAGDWDRKPDNPQQWKHWIGPEHRGGYHGLTVAMAEALYDCGVVFDRADMQRFVNTQMQVCWNGSCDAPTFKNTGGKATGAEMVAPALARFEPKIWEFCYGPRATKARLARPDHGWQGGVVAIGYLCGKYLAPRTPEAAQTRYREQFCRRPENVAFLKSLEFQVTAAKP